MKLKNQVFRSVVKHSDSKKFIYLSYCVFIASENTTYVSQDFEDMNLRISYESRPHINLNVAGKVATMDLLNDTNLIATDGEQTETLQQPIEKKEMWKNRLSSTQPLLVKYTDTIVSNQTVGLMF